MRPLRTRLINSQASMRPLSGPRSRFASILALRTTSCFRSLVSVAPPSRQLSARNTTPRPAANPIDVTTTGSVESQPSFPSAHAEWCRQKYRSYHAEDNTYRSFSGKRRACLSPYLDASSGTAVAVADQPTPDHLSWCSQRYASYDPADNTYQPFGGGPRRPCVSSQAQ